MKKVFTLAEVFSPHFADSRKAAFTLAEVLITLGIIGVVAAMTMPTLLQKHQEQTTVAKVKKFYSLINQALLLAIKDNGYVDEWNFIEFNENGGLRSSEFVQYLKPYLKISKDCAENTGCLKYSENIKLLNGNVHSVNYETNPYFYKMILADGTYIYLRRDNISQNKPCTGTDFGYTNVCGGVWIDINGGNQPNTIGKDIFTFVILKNRIMPDKTDECTLDSKGWGCANYILQHGNMNYLH